MVRRGRTLLLLKGTRNVNSKMLVLGFIMLTVTQMALGQVSHLRDGSEDARTVVQRLVEDIKHNRPVPWQALIGRDDIIGELRKASGSLDSKERMQILDAVLNIGMQKDQRRWVQSSAVTAYLVEVAVDADDKGLRQHAGELLVEYVPATYIKVHAAELLKATKEGKLQNALLLGKTGAEEGLELVAKGGKLWSVDDVAARAAAAKLGDTAISRSFVEAYQQEKDGRKKACLAKTLGYIGDATCVLALARDMRTPIVYDAGGWRRSLRVDIVAALGEVYPQEAVLQKRDVQGDQEADEWYDAVEKWLERYLEITWQTERPKPFSSTPLPLP